MPYDPQRSHRRPQLADDAPAPIDALLGTEPTEIATPPTAGSNGVNGTSRSELNASVPSASTREGSSGEPDVHHERRRPLLAVGVLVVVAVLLAFAWLRRRR
jgi:hypothetical protein